MTSRRDRPRFGRGPCLLGLRPDPIALEAFLAPAADRLAVGDPAG